MIPVSLQIRNFLSYGPETQTIDFSPYPLICLSGKNGHGKSAILDALTWALWGEARKTSGTIKADEHLLYAGQHTMLVSLQCSIQGNLYVIRREYTKPPTGKPNTSLTIGLVDPVRQATQPIGGNTIRSNQEAINGIVRLDFETFCSSALIRQGQSNEFSTKTPRERKDILASILRLDRYDEIRTRALEHARTCSCERTRVKTVLDRLHQEIAEARTAHGLYTTLQQQYAELAEYERSLLAREHANSLLEQSIMEQQRTYDAMKHQYATLKEAKKTHEEQFRSLVSSWRQTHRAVFLGPSPEQLEQQRATLNSELTTEQKNYALYIETKEQHMLQQHYAMTLRNEYSQHIAEYREQQQKLLDSYLGNQIRVASLLAAAQQERARCAVQAQEALARHKSIQESLCTACNEGEWELFQRTFDKRKRFYQDCLLLVEKNSAERTTLAQRAKLASSLEASCCPLCEQTLSGDAQEAIHKRIAADLSRLDHRQARLAKLLQNLKTVLQQQDKKHKVLMQEQATLKTLRAEQESLAHLHEQACKRLQEIDAQLQSLHTEQVTLETVIAAAKLSTDQHITGQEELYRNDSRVMACGAQCALLEKTLATIVFNPTRQRTLLADLRDLEAKLVIARSCETEKALQKNRAHETDRLRYLLKDANHAMTILAAELMPLYEKLSQQEAAFTEEKRTILNLRQRFENSKSKLLEQKGALEQQLSRSKALEEEYRREQESLHKLAIAIDDYQIVAAATGKDGIQALLMHELLPEIEYEANTILGRLTDNQAHIHLASLRDLKSGDVRETLDIIIADEKGVRPYELFSGGEAFRIDFALRIALSKILARRAGTALQTIIIDEGFGSQDEEGLLLVLGALRTIQHDFAKIIVVSHLPMVKDHLPVHMHVEKLPTGSVVQVIEQF